jgi:hypothetical protein
MRLAQRGTSAGVSRRQHHSCPKKQRQPTLHLRRSRNSVAWQPQCRVLLFF